MAMFSVEINKALAYFIFPLINLSSTSISYVHIFLYEREVSMNLITQISFSLINSDPVEL